MYDRGGEVVPARAADKMNENDKSVKCESSASEQQQEEADMVERELAEDAEWKRIQQNTFTRWANEHLKCANNHISDLESDLSDGLRLIGLIEVLAQKRLPKHNKKPTFRSQKLENVSVALKFLENQGIRIVNIGTSLPLSALLYYILCFTSLVLLKCCLVYMFVCM